MKSVVTERVITLNDITFDTIIGFQQNNVKFFPHRVQFGSSDGQIQVSSFRQIVSGWSSWRFEETQIEEFRNFLEGKNVFQFDSKTELLEWLAE